MAEKKAAKGILVPSVSNTLTLTHNYGPLLLKHGPLFKGVWAVPPDLRDALKAAGQPVPAPVHGAFLLDTGASTTCISVKAANALSLKATRIERGFGADGEMESPIFLAELHIPVPTRAGASVDLAWGGEMRGVKDLEQAMRDIHYAGNPIEVVGLLGRDLLRFTRFHYDGIAGALSIDFDLTSMQSVMRGTPSLPSPTPAGEAPPP